MHIQFPNIQRKSLPHILWASLSLQALTIVIIVSQINWSPHMMIPIWIKKMESSISKFSSVWPNGTCSRIWPMVTTAWINGMGEKHLPRHYKMALWSYGIPMRTTRKHLECSIQLIKAWLWMWIKKMERKSRLC